MVGTKVNTDALVRALSEPDAQLKYLADWESGKPGEYDYLSLDQDGTVSITRLPSSETGKPEDVHYRRRLWWRLPPGFDAPWLSEWLQWEGKDALQAVMDGWTLEWKNGNCAGVLTPEAAGAREAIEEEFASYGGPFHQLADGDYFQDGLREEAQAVLDGTPIEIVVDEYLIGGDYTAQQLGNCIVYVTRDLLRYLIEQEVRRLEYNREDEL